MEKKSSDKGKVGLFGCLANRETYYQLKHVPSLTKSFAPVLTMFCFKKRKRNLRENKNTPTKGESRERRSLAPNEEDEVENFPFFLLNSLACS